LVITWSEDLPENVLETATNLNQPTLWVPVTNPPSQLIGGERVVTFGITNKSKFFRLRVPVP
jgi:hypothetical protein